MLNSLISNYLIYLSKFYKYWYDVCFFPFKRTNPLFSDKLNTLASSILIFSTVSINSFGGIPSTPGDLLPFIAFIFLARICYTRGSVGSLDTMTSLKLIGLVSTTYYVCQTGQTQAIKTLQPETSVSKEIMKQIPHLNLLCFLRPLQLFIYSSKSSYYYAKIRG